jgi:hypothetical protein
MSIVFLRVKIKSLAAEAGIIRHEEAKYPRGRRGNPTWHELNHHRRVEVRKEARAACLAYGLLRGRAYQQLEAKCREAPDLATVVRLVMRYGLGRNLPKDKAQLTAWVQDWFFAGVKLDIPARVVRDTAV